MTACDSWGIRVRLGKSSRTDVGRLPPGEVMVSVVCLLDLLVIGFMTPLAAVMGTSVCGRGLVIPEVWAWSGGG